MKEPKKPKSIKEIEKEIEEKGLIKLKEERRFYGDIRRTDASYIYWMGTDTTEDEWI